MCQEKIVFPTPFSPGCGDGDKDAGLCYKKCDNGYDGIGPVCWGVNPPGWVNCGFGSAKDKAACDWALADQVMSVGFVLLNIGTLGATSSTTPIVKGSSQWDDMVVKFKDATAKAAKIAEKYGIKETIDVLDMSLDMKALAELDLDRLLPEDIIRISATMTAVFDPSGVVGLVGAYSFPKCSKLMN